MRMKRHSAINRTACGHWRGSPPASLGALASAPAHAQGTPTSSKPIDVQTLPGQQLQLTLRTVGPAAEPLSFTIDNPARISLDLPNTALALPSRRIDVRSAGLDTIARRRSQGRTRLVLNLDRLVPYQTRVDGNNIIVMLGADAGAAAAAASARAAGAPVARRRRRAAGPRAIRAIDFRRGADGAGRVIVQAHRSAHARSTCASSATRSSSTSPAPSCRRT